MRRAWRCALAGGLAGAVNGLFGGAGGTVLVPLLRRTGALEEREVFATSVAVILPLCALSAVIYLLRGGLELGTALPYLLGGTLGGWIGGRCFRKTNAVWLRRGFGLLLIFGGLRCVL